MPLGNSLSLKAVLCPEKKKIATANNLLEGSEISNRIAIITIGMVDLTRGYT